MILNKLEKMRKEMGNIISSFLNNYYNKEWYKELLIAAGDLDIVILKLKKELK